MADKGEPSTDVDSAGTKEVPSSSEPMDEDAPSTSIKNSEQLSGSLPNAKEDRSKSNCETSQLKKEDSGISIPGKAQEDIGSSDDSHSVNGEGDHLTGAKEKKRLKIAKEKVDDAASSLKSSDSEQHDTLYSFSEFSDSGVANVSSGPSGSREHLEDRNSDSSGKSRSELNEDFYQRTRDSNNEESTDLYDDISIKSDDTCKMSSSDDDFDPTPNTLRPKHKWFVCQEVVGRQCGTSNRFSSDLFRLRCYGSLHMVERLELMYKMKKHEGCVNTLHFNNSGTRLVSGSDDLNVIIWDWSVGDPVLVYDSGHRSNVFQAKFMPLSGDCHIVSCARDGQVRIAELSTTGVCKNTRRLAQHRGPAHKLALEMDSPHSFLSCGEDAVVYEIDLRESKPEKLCTVKENDKKVALYTIFTNPTKTYEFAVGGRDHFVRVYDKRFLPGGLPIKKFCPHNLINSDITTNVTCLVYNYNGTEILASYNDDDIYSFNALHSTGADYIHKYRGHRNSQTVKGVNYFGPKSEYVVSGSDCGFIYLWDSETEHIVQSMHGDEGGVVNCLEPHPTCPVLATSGLDDDVKIWVPSYEDTPDLKDLKSRIRSNMRGREEDRKCPNGSDAIDGQMLWFLLHHLRRSSRGSARQSGIEHDESSSSSSDSSSEDVDVSHAIHCTQS